MAVKIQASVGYRHLPSHTTEGSKASYARQATQDVRASMAAIINNYDQLLRKIHSATPEALLEILQPTFQKSLTYVPVKTGALKASGRMGVEKLSRYQRAFIAYGRPELHYAAIVHERTDLHHMEPTRAKFLQSAMEEDFSDFRDRIIEQFRVERFT